MGMTTRNITAGSPLWRARKIQTLLPYADYNWRPGPVDVVGDITLDQRPLDGRS